MPSSSVDTTSRPIKGVPCKKRRKVIHENGGSCVDRDGLNENGDGGLLTIKSKKLQTGHDEPSACVSCHRVLLTSSVECALCHSLSCVICTRHCTAPATTSSMTRITTLPLAPSDTNTGSNAPHHDVRVRLSPSGTTPSGRYRRRKLESDDPELEEYSVNPSHAGCGRTICRRCCVENDVTHAYTCIDCLEIRQEREKGRDIIEKGKETMVV